MAVHCTVLYLYSRRAIYISIHGHVDQAGIYMWGNWDVNPGIPGRPVRCAGA